MHAELAIVVGRNNWFSVLFRSNSNSDKRIDDNKQFLRNHSRHNVHDHNQGRSHTLMLYMHSGQHRQSLLSTVSFTALFVL